jgi:hypothetical protein
MERDLKAVEGAFRSKGFTFVCEASYRDVDLPGSARHDCRTAQTALVSSGALPNLSGAPVASWLLARVARLAGKRFPYSYGQVLGSDAAAYWMRYFVVSEVGKPLGILSLSGNSRDIKISLTYTTDAVPEEICEAFFAGLLEKSSDVARCRIVSIYTELTDPDCRFVLPRVYGWDGKRFLNETAPEHALEDSGDFD